MEGEESLETERRIEMWENRILGERQLYQHRNEKLCRMNGEHLGWIVGTQKWEGIVGN